MPGVRGVFFCYALPAPVKPPAGAPADAPVEWSTDAGATKWYLFDLATENIAEEPTAITPICSVGAGLTKPGRGKKGRILLDTAPP